MIAPVITALAAFVALAPAPPPSSGARDDAFDPAQAASTARESPPRRPAPRRDPDGELLPDLELLQNLELLEHLDLFDDAR